MFYFNDAQDGSEEDGASLYSDPLALEFGFSRVFDGSSTEDLAKESQLGNIYVRGYDKTGRPALYFKPGGAGFNAETAGVKYLVYCVERAIACVEKQAASGNLTLPPDDPVGRKFVLLVDFDGLGMSSLITGSIVRDLIGVMQDHYPERLGVAFFVNAPWLLHGFFTAASTFLDPVTIAKFNFISDDVEGEVSGMFAVWMLFEREREYLAAGSVLEPSLLDPGLEYAEQLRLSGLLNDDADEEANSSDYMEFLHVYRHWKVLNLPPTERALVRGLAKRLAFSLTRQEDKELLIQASMLIRYLRSKHWDVTKAEAAVCATAKWRQENVSCLYMPDVKSGRCSAAIVRECALGHFYIRGFDRRQRPVVYVKFRNPDSGQHQETLNYVVYVLERLLAVLQKVSEQKVSEQPEDGVDNDCATMLVDFTGYESSNRPRLCTLRAALQIFQDHYPEIFGDVYFYYPPQKIVCFWNCVGPFIEQRVRDRVVLVTSPPQWRQLLTNTFDAQRLERSLGGENQAVFSSKIFLSKKVAGSIFGHEFDAQAAAPDTIPRARVSFSNIVQQVEESGASTLVQETAEPEGPLTNLMGTISWLFT
ncbi:unnamed protein product [Symbiodinium pilosum]|uniref:CRAL-TRIO domain-containing protein n=1 Tax=Symbiodinium pilosum TaxID=2952 RepID=A0A812WGH0_SYMPI|nr:unnamed protein product [Symbiodinium pilosum]